MDLIGSDTACHICHAEQLTLLSNYPNLPRVASDCVPWRSGGKLAICDNCLCVQNPVDQQWHKEAAEIYSHYQIYRQSAGSEQGVLSEDKKLLPRSAKIFQKILPYLDISKKGRLLDIGCANGELLRTFSTLAPYWKMVGFEINDRCRKEVENIKGVEAFAYGSLDKLEEPYDLITLVHVLEHLPDPIKWLKNFHRLLKKNGMILIQVPDPKQNPYNLLVADHCSHFIMSDLVNVAQSAGYTIIAQSDKWVLREFSLLIRPNDPHVTVANKTQLNDRTPTYPSIALKWLHNIFNLAKSFPKDKPRGIWGTAIAGTWFYSLMENNVDFFVDEDKNRIGQTHLGKPIYHPAMAPKESNIFIALTPEISTDIINRWSHLSLHIHVPPHLDYYNVDL